MTNVWYHPPPGHVVMVADFPAQHWVLQLIADFSVLQSSIELALQQKLSLTTPALAAVIQKKYLRRLSDEDRWSLVKALAVDCDYDGDLSEASNAFWRCKRVRDLFAHRSDLALVREPDSSEYFYMLSGDTPNGLPSPLTPAEVRQSAADCRWLRALVDHLASLGGVRYASFAAKEFEDGSWGLPALEVLQPPPLPVPPDWEPTDLSRETGAAAIPVRRQDD